MRKKIALMIFFSIMAVLPLASAYWYSGWYGGSPNMLADLLENEWVIFVILFAIFYTTIFTSLGKVFQGNKSAPAVIALALSFLVTAGIQRQWMFLEKPIMYWALILTLALVVLTFFRAMRIGPAGLIGLILLLVGLWPFIKNSMGISGLAGLPYGLITFLDSINGFFWIALIIAGLLLVIFNSFKKDSGSGTSIYFGGK